MRAQSFGRERLRRDCRSFRTWKYLRVLLQKAPFHVRLQSSSYPDFSFVLQTIIHPFSFFCPIPSWVIRLSKKIFTKKNTGKKGRVSVISLSFFVSTKNFNQLQYQIFWFFKNEIMYGINRINFGKDFWKFFGNFWISRGTVEFNFRLYEINDRFYRDSASKL